MPSVAVAASPFTGGAATFLTAAVLAGSLSLGACSTPSSQSHAAPPYVQSLLEARRDGVIIQQWDLSCGAAALATLLTFQHGDPVPEKAIAEAMLRRTDPLRVQVRGGFSLLDLKRYADSRGLAGNGYGEMTLETLAELGPAIVPIRTKGYNHFVVFRGVRDGRILLSDPAFGKRTMTPERFEEIWLGKLAFTVERPDGPAPPGRLAPDGDQILLPPDALVRTAIR